MSVDRAGVIDGVGLRPDGSAVEMVVYDHLEWSDPTHLELLAAKVEAYANAVLSGQLEQIYPFARGRNASIKLVYQHRPNRHAEHFFASVAQRLASVGIGFTHTALPPGY